MLALWEYFWVPPPWPTPVLVYKPSTNVGGMQATSVSIKGGTGEIVSAGGNQGSKGSVGN